MYQSGQGFVPDEYRERAVILIMGQDPGGDEEAGRLALGRDAYEPHTPAPFIGKTGRVLMEHYLPLAGLTREDVSLANVIRCRWRNSNALPPQKILAPAIEHCSRAHFRPPASTKLVVAHGSLAWHWLTGYPTGKPRYSISEWRGFLAVDPPTKRPWPVYATIHTADLFRDPKMATPAGRDWNKLPKVLTGAWPLPYPDPLIADSTVGHLLPWLWKAQNPISLDTEFDPDNNYLLDIGFASHGQVGIARWSRLPRGEQAKLTAVVGAMALLNQVVMHNIGADLPVIEQNMGIPIPTWKHLDDTMLAHALLWSDLPHDLGFIQSLYGRYPQHKHLSHQEKGKYVIEDPVVYLVGDVLGTEDGWGGLQRELQADLGSARLYQEQSLPLIREIIIPTEQRGVLRDPSYIRAKLGEAKRRLTELSRSGAEAADLWRPICQRDLGSTIKKHRGPWKAIQPFNLGSDAQMKRYCYAWRKYPVRRHRETRRPSVDKDSLAMLRMALSMPDLVIEARIEYQELAQQVAHYLGPFSEGKNS